jgi:sRNA-binding carbon storage regulator CsrA
MIGREIIVAISSIEGRGRRVELLIEAPEHISVDREEVYLKKRSVKSAPAPTEPRGAPR